MQSVSSELVALLIGAVVVAGSGAGIVWAGRAMIAGRLHPNMGHQNERNTTPESWRATQIATGKAFVRCGWAWVAAAVIMALLVPVGVALLVISAIVLLMQIAGATKLLEPLPGHPNA